VINIFFLHPSSNVLQSFIDGELSNLRQRRILRHLKSCASCRLEAQQLKADLAWFVAVDREGILEQDGELNDGLARLESRMHFLNFSASPETLGLHCYSLARGQLRDRVFSELEVYLGSHAATALLEKLGNSETAGFRGTLEAECLLAAFLGRDVAAKIIKRIILVSQAVPLAGPQPPLAHGIV